MLIMWITIWEGIACDRNKNWVKIALQSKEKLIVIYCLTPHGLMMISTSLNKFYEAYYVVTFMTRTPRLHNNTLPHYIDT